METWRDIEDFEGYYKVSDLGNVKSLERYIMNNGGVQKRSEKILKAHSDKKNGHLMVVLCKDGKTYPKLVHRLVAEAFIPNPENKPVVDHIDTDPTNNKVDNLRWVTQQENCMNPLTRINNSKSKIGPPYHRFEYTDEVREKVRNALVGRKVSEETRHKLSESHKGLKRSKKSIEKTAQAHRGVPRDEETKKKISESHKGKLKGKHWKIEGGKRLWY